MKRLGVKICALSSDTVAFDCPGCQRMHSLAVKQVDGRPVHAVWGFNHDAQRPTFTPSIKVTTHTWAPPVTADNLADWQRKPWEQHKVKHICHSIVTDGRIQFLDDCTHKLAGRTVDLPDWS